MRTGIPWRDRPAFFGSWNTVFKRFGQSRCFRSAFRGLFGPAGHGVRHGRRNHRQGPPPRPGRKGGLKARP
ncbi:transposase [Mesorhizobium tamadayense]|uniref:transposase n=1 Tax=Mesorhizobium tamadayense TaxID=425306 RepID=UPI00142E77E1